MASETVACVILIASFAVILGMILLTAVIIGLPKSYRRTMEDIYQLKRKKWREESRREEVHDGE